MEKQDLLIFAKKTISNEANSIANLKNLLTDEFAEAVLEIYNSKGRVIVTGIGKSAIIAQKIVATFNSTGTPAIFMHAADAIHGDLGIIQRDDVVIFISKSGNTPEIKVLVSLIRNYKNKLIGITGNTSSYLAENATYVLNSYIETEACPNDLAPTTSTTAQMVIGDCLAVCLVELRGFSSEDFAKYHPGGSLGKKLYLRVSDITSKNTKPKVSPDTSVIKVIIEISEKMLGAAAVIDQEKIVGIITDGDIRRMITENNDFQKLTAKDIMGKNPKTIDNNRLAVDAIDILEENKITQVIAEENGIYKGIVHVHDLIKEGII
ncbi:MAG TPA: KpsF/GutQ family sugar-phosphate isomerase [Flavobacteriaceae bacterium]|nr:KpsF/GutQ family sugar-phosphate isomerase [Flavobacteriaceae bacterium]